MYTAGLDHKHHLLALAAIAITIPLTAAQTPVQTKLPRMVDGKPNLEGIWQAYSSAAADLQDHVASLNMTAGRSVVTGGLPIPYKPEAAAQKAANFQNRMKDDPLGKCYIPGVPRVMYLDFPFQIFQTPRAVTMAFEWSMDYRLILTDGSPHPETFGVDSWMGDSRGHWDGDTLVVDVTQQNDKTWLDMAGDFHSDAMHVVERYRMTGADTIQYEATIEDPKVFTKPWSITIALHRRTDRDRLFEYNCEAETEEANGAFTRQRRTWYPGDGSPLAAMTTADSTRASVNPPTPVPGIHRTADGKPDFQGLYNSASGGANYGLEKHNSNGLVPGGRGVVTDPADGKLPMQPWAVEEHIDRNREERGYDDPTAHCFPAGVPRSMYVPSALYIVQTPDYVIFLHERVAWRIVPLLSGANAGRPHLPDNMRLWQGDSLGHWEGDTLVIDTTNFNGKTWLNETGEVLSYAEHAVERLTPTGPDAFRYEATITDPVVYTRPWTISFTVNRQKGELIEVACHEEDRDLIHLKAVRDAAAAKKK
jgi:hypothetical protein